jgi:hypothetical protein
VLGDTLSDTQGGVSKEIPCSVSIPTKVVALTCRKLRPRRYHPPGRVTQGGTPWMG